MTHLGFELSKADPDVWFHEGKRKNGEIMYTYVLLHTDNCPVILDRAEAILCDEISRYFVLKEELIGPPSQYLGGKLHKVTLENGIDEWAFGSAHYVNATVDNVDTYLKSKEEKLVAQAPAPLSNGYRPAIDVSSELQPAEASHFHSLIGILCWIVELGRADICIEVSMMSSYLALPREGHMKELFHIFAYLKKHHNAEMIFDPSEPKLNESLFPAQDWSFSVYGIEDLKE